MTHSGSLVIYHIPCSCPRDVKNNLPCSNQLDLHTRRSMYPYTCPHYTDLLNEIFLLSRVPDVSMLDWQCRKNYVWLLRLAVVLPLLVLALYLWYHTAATMPVPGQGTVLYGSPTSSGSLSQPGQGLTLEETLVQYRVWLETGQPGEDKWHFSSTVSEHGIETFRVVGTCTLYVRMMYTYM